MTYETAILSLDNALKFIALVNEKVGTETDRTEHGEDEHSVVVLDLETQDEYNLCKESEISLETE